MNKILLIIIFLLSAFYLLIDSSSNTTFFNNEVININLKRSNGIEKKELEEYIVGVVASEMPASFNVEALKAQAVASRTYALYKASTSNKEYDLVASISNQGYIDINKMKEKWGNDFDKYYNKIKNAVIDTKGEVMYYDGKIVEAYYFAMSNGYTEKASLVFSEDKDYLQSIPSLYDKSIKNFEVSKTMNKKDFIKLLNINCNDIIINNIKRSNTNRINLITICNKEFKGTKVRKLLNLRSTDFDIKLDNDNIIITTRGYGHGVGMSQYGANGMAISGSNYKDILKYYYKNIEIVKI